MYWEGQSEGCHAQVGPVEGIHQDHSGTKADFRNAVIWGRFPFRQMRPVQQACVTSAPVLQRRMPSMA